jgi:RimJ/RimL family protein N-acetyltransferase
MVKLVPFEETDFKQLISWIDSEETLIQFAGPIFTYPLTPQQLMQYLDDKNRFAFKVVNELYSQTIGHAEIYLPNKQMAYLCRIMIGDPMFRGKGFGQQIVNQLLEIAFTQLGVERTELNVFDWNTSAIKCYEKAGYVINPGKAKKREVKGQTWTALNMSLTKTQWQNLKEIK